jgi:hypothetical protein
MIALLSEKQAAMYRQDNVPCDIHQFITAQVSWHFCGSTVGTSFTLVRHWNRLFLQIGEKYIV